jgi:hypothetical protein
MTKESTAHVIQLTGRVLDWGDDHLAEAADGDIQIQAQIDAAGRFAIRGGHTNFGYSGRYVGFVCLRGARKRLVDWWTLFPSKEHHFAAQQDKPQVEALIRDYLEARTGAEVIKVPRGYAFDSQAHLERQAAKETDQ